MDWSLDSYFTAPGGDDYVRFKRDLGAALQALAARIEAQEGFEPGTFAAWQAVVTAFEDILRRLSHLTSYLECLTAGDAGSEEGQRELVELAQLQAEANKLETRLISAFGEARHDQFEAFLKRDALADATFALRRWRERARRQMSTEEEALAAELEVDGLKAWSRLYDIVAGTLEFTLQRPDGRREQVGVARRRSLMTDADRAVRKAAFDGGNEAWRGVETVCGAALNAIAGSRITLCHRRNHAHALEPALFQHRIGERALEALREAVLSRAELARGLLRAKARRLGLPGLAWYDLEAPSPIAGHGSARLEWENAVARVQGVLGASYPALGAFMAQMVGQHWFDWSPRRGKRPGAFCSSSLLHNESRIFLSFEGSLNDVLTLAHEVGHAWHAHLLREARPLARDYPMTLGESASTFAEMLFIDGLLAGPEVAEATKAQVLDLQARQAVGFLLDVPMRFEFERRLHEERTVSAVPVSRLKTLMVEAQRTFFGDALEAGGEDPLFWASKLHFYLADVPFYNFPYTVGFLLSRALFARFKQAGADFLPHYEAFLARSGSAGCETLAREILGADLESPDFWGAVIDGLGPLAASYAALAPEP